MRTGRDRIVSLTRFVLFSTLLLLSSIATAANGPILAVPPFKGATSHPALLTGLQQILIDDLRASRKTDIMTRAAFHRLFKQSGKRPNAPFYVKDLPAIRDLLAAKWVLLNTVTERDGRSRWKVQLANRQTASVVQTWTFEGNLSDLFDLKQQVLSTVHQALSWATEHSGAKQQSNRPDAALSALMTYSQGLKAFDQYQYAEAIRRFRQAVAQDKRFHYPRRQLDLVRSAVEQQVTSPRELGLFWLADQKPKKAQGYLQEALRQNPQDTAVLLALNQIAMDRKQYRSARQLAAKVQEINPKDPQAWVQFSKLAQAEKQPLDAIQHLEKARELTPHNADINRHLGQLYKATAQPAKAAEAYQTASSLYGEKLQIQDAKAAISKARQLAPKDTNLLLQEGDLLQQTGQLKKAQSSYQKANQLAPDKADPFQRLGEIHRLMGNKQAERESLEKAMRIDSTHVDANIQMAQIHLENQEYEMATAHLKIAKQNDSANATIGKVLGQTYAKSGKIEAAINELQPLAQGSTTDPELLATYGEVLHHSGRLKDAQSQFEAAVRLDPDNATAYKSLGIIQQEQGEVAKAKFAFTRAKHIAPELAIPEIEAPEIQEEIAQLANSFPEIQARDTAATVAIIDTDKWIQTDRLFRTMLNKIMQFGTLYRPNATHAVAAFTQALQQTYSLAPVERVEASFAKAPYRSMTSDDLSDAVYLEQLCEELQVDALAFYRAVPWRNEDSQNQLKITAILFDKATGASWVNESYPVYPQTQAQTLNWPMVIALVLVSSGIIVGIVKYIAKGSGALKVNIYQDEHKQKAVFSVILSKKPNKDLTAVKSKLLQQAKKKDKNSKYERKVKFAKKYERFFIFNDASFEKLHVGTYYVYLYGVILDGERNQIGNYQLTQQVIIQKQLNRDITFDLRRTTRPVDIQVFEGENSATGAEVSIKGQGESKYVKDESGVSFHLSTGTYTVLVQHQDGLFTEEIHLPNLDKDYHFTIDLPATAAASCDAQPTSAPEVEMPL